MKVRHPWWYDSSVYRVPCPKCEAPVRERCRTLTTHKTTDVHAARWDAAFPKRGSI